LKPILAVILAVVLAGCGRPPEEKQPEKHYHLAGEVTALNRKDQTATVKHGAIGDWMGAMTMEYPIKSKAEFDSLKVGEQIEATVDVVGDTDYSLSGIQRKGPGK
jgi:Cu/Ag efflux protein CusF